jgi:hypothetical protein
MPHPSCLPWAPHIATTEVLWRKGKPNVLLRIYTHWAIWENQMRS